jgi:anti-sigma-K factor RskA
MSELHTDDQLAFDYVAGVMRGDERKAIASARTFLGGGANRHERYS